MHSILQHLNWVNKSIKSKKIFKLCVNGYFFIMVRFSLNLFLFQKFKNEIISHEYSWVL